MAGLRVVRQGLAGALEWFPLQLADAERLRSDPVICTGVLGGLHVAGATLALAWLVLPHAADADPVGVSVCIAAAYAVGVGLLTWARRAGFGTIELLLGFASVVLISGANHFSGGPGTVFAPFYVLAGLYAFAFLRPSHALVHVVLIAAAYAVTLLTALHPAPLGAEVTHWLILVGVVLCTGLIVLALAEGLRRGERRFRNALDASSLGAGVINTEGRLIYVNRALRTMLGATESGREAMLADRLDPTGARELAHALDAVRRGAQRTVEIETRIRVTQADVLVTVSQLDEHEPVHTLVQVQDIADRVHALASSRQLAAVIESSKDAIFIKDLDGTIQSWNRGAEQLYGYTEAQVVGRDIEVITGPERRAEASEVIDQLKAGQPVHTLETARRHRDGRQLHVSISFAPLRDHAGALTSVIALARDVTEQRRMERELADRERRYRMMFERNPQPMWVYDRDTLRFLDVNAFAVASYGYTREEFLSMTIADIRPDEDRDRLAHSLSSEAACTEEGDVWRHKRRNGEIIDVQVLADDFELDGRRARLVVATDITARLDAERRLRELADHDPLTGLWSRGKLERELDAQLTAKAGAGWCALVVLDVDHFKYVNDSFGHARGDDLLRRVAAVLRGLLRDDAQIARLGGDEFALLLPDASEAEAREVAGRLVTGIRESVREGRRRITASAGVAASTPELHVASEELLMAADIALYEAKDAGRDRLAVAVGVARGHTWIDEIRAALNEDRLVLYAQPIIDLRTGATVREELLVRMVDTRGDLVQPASFIPASERFGLVNEIDRWVVARGLELARSGRRLEINLSAHSLGDPEITHMVAAAIEHGLDPANVVFEITETAAASNYAEAADFAHRLSRLGCGFALDDFGTGFGSFSYLKHVPIGYLKIDTEFVRSLATEPASQNIVRAVVTIAAQLGQTTIAEGVEEAASLEVLRALGVDHAQGYHIARPGPADAPPTPLVNPAPAQA